MGYRISTPLKPLGNNGVFNAVSHCARAIRQSGGGPFLHKYPGRCRSHANDNFNKVMVMDAHLTKVELKELLQIYETIHSLLKDSTEPDWTLVSK